MGELDNYESQVLRFCTTPFATPTAFVGPVSLTLSFSATAIDTYFVVRLSDIAPDGRRTKLSWGWILASHRTIDPARSNPQHSIERQS